MTPFIAFCLWLLACWLVARRVQPLQPDRLEDDLGDVDVTERRFQVALREAEWWERPAVNLRLSRKWVRDASKPEA